MKEEALKVLLRYIDNSKEANDALSELLVIFNVSGSLPIEFLEWTEKGMWTKWESRTDGYHEMQGWYNTHNYAAMKQPLSSQELYDLFISERGGNDR